MNKWLKRKLQNLVPKRWPRLRAWYLRKFFNILTCIKPSGTISMIGPYTDGIHPTFPKYARNPFVDIER